MAEQQTPARGQSSAQQERKTTTYMVLWDKGNGAVEFVGTADALTPKAAVDSVTGDGSSYVEGSTRTYIAVPARNWNVVERSYIRPEPQLQTEEHDAGVWIRNYTLSTSQGQTRHPADAIEEDGA